MWNSDEAHFAGDYFFRNQSFAATTDAQVSPVFPLGGTEGGIRVRGKIEGSAGCASGNTVKVVLEGADAEDATSWRKIAENTVTASGTSLSGELFSFVPDTGDAYIRVRVTNSEGMTGSFSVAEELIP